MKKILWLIMVIVLVFIACNNQDKRKEISLEIDKISLDSTNAPVTNQTANNNAIEYGSIISSKAAIISSIDSTKKFIRIAQIKSKVSNVVKSTLNIENATVKHGGFVTSSLLQSNTNKTEVVEKNNDSLQENIYYTTTSIITCRVPNNKLDALLKDIAKNLVFIDYRNVKAEDVTLDFTKNNLIQKRTDDYKKRLNKIADHNATKPSDISNIADGIIAKQQQQDDAMLDKLIKLDAIEYSTVTVEIYQPESIVQHTIVNSNSNKYRPSFIANSWKSIKCGWQVVLNFVVFMLQIWPLILLGFLALVVYKKYFASKPKAN